MTAILTAILVVAVVGILCAVMLVVASKVFFVPVDERLPLVRECLPGAGCGACGYPGCDGYAEALVSGKTTDCTLCIPGGSACAAAIAKVMGMEAGEVAKKVAYFHVFKFAWKLADYRIFKSFKRRSDNAVAHYIAKSNVVK